MKLEKGTKLILRRKMFIGDKPHYDIPAKLVRVYGKSFMVDVNGVISYVPQRFINNKGSDINSDPAVIVLPHWYQLEKATVTE